MHRSLSFASAFSAAVMISGIAYAGGNDNQISPSSIQQGKAIAPVPLNLTGKVPASVYLGSYIVNGIGDCSGCHSFPQYLNKRPPGTNLRTGSPYDGTPQDQSVTGQLVATFNTAHYLAGGQCFGPFMARNLTPESNDQPYPGLPEGLTEAEFIKVLRTGEDIHCEKEPSDPICALFRIPHFGAAAEGWNSCSPSTSYAPIAACPSGDTSHCAKRLAKACLGTGCFAELSKITS